MKKIEAIIRKSKFDDVVKALQEAEVYFFSYWDVTGVGNEKIGKVYRGITYSTKDIQRRYLSIVVSDTFVDALLQLSVLLRCAVNELTTFCTVNVLTRAFPSVVRPDT